MAMVKTPLAEGAAPKQRLSQSAYWCGSLSLGDMLYIRKKKLAAREMLELDIELR